MSDIPNKHSFSVAGTNLSSFQRLGARGVPGYGGGDQIARVFGKSVSGGGAGSVLFVLVDPIANVRYLEVSATLTAGTARDDAAGTGGLYLLTVDVGGSGSAKLDLLGASGFLEWRVGYVDAGGLGALDLYLDYSPVL